MSLMLQAKKKLLMAQETGLDVSEVFNASIWTGISAGRTITTGIDAAANKSLVWVKSRSGVYKQFLVDTVRGAGVVLSSNNTLGNQFDDGVVAFGSSGYNLDTTFAANGTGETFVGWQWREAPNYFDIVTFSHTNGVASTIDLSDLGVVGFATIKRTDSTSDWYAWHRALTGGNNLKLNAADAQSTSDAYVAVSGTTLTFSASASTGSYVLNAWAHDAAPGGNIQCGIFTTNGSNAGSYAHGWAGGSQFAMLKCITLTGDWEMYDRSRSPGWTTDLRLLPNLTNAEDTVTRISESAGTISFAGLSASQTYIAMLIRA